MFKNSIDLKDYLKINLEIHLFYLEYLAKKAYKHICLF